MWSFELFKIFNTGSVPFDAFNHVESWEIVIYSTGSFPFDAESHVWRLKWKLNQRKYSFLKSYSCTGIAMSCTGMATICTGMAMSCTGMAMSCTFMSMRCTGIAMRCTGKQSAVPV